MLKVFIKINLKFFCCYSNSEDAFLPKKDVSTEFLRNNQIATYQGFLSKHFFSSFKDVLIMRDFFSASPPLPLPFSLCYTKEDFPFLASPFPLSLPKRTFFQFFQLAPPLSLPKRTFFQLVQLLRLPLSLFPEHVHRLGLRLLAARRLVGGLEVVLVDLDGVVLANARLHGLAGGN